MRIKESAILHNGVMWTGRRHSDIIRKIIEEAKPTVSEVVGPQGFVTECGKFVGRLEAARVALESGQVAKLGWPPRLYSEDLY